MGFLPILTTPTVMVDEVAESPEFLAWTFREPLHPEEEQGESGGKSKEHV